MRSSPSGIWTALVIAAVSATSIQCAQDTSRLTPEQEARLNTEGIVRRADNVVFHFTRETGYRRGETREDRREVWSFEPPEDAEGWTQDIRAVISPARRGRSRTSPGRSGS